MVYVSVKNLNFSYGKKKLFNNISFNVNCGDLVCISLSSSKGKTTLLNLLSYNIRSTSSILIDNKNINEEIKDKISLLSRQTIFYGKNVLEELLITSGDVNLIKKLLKDFNMLNYIKKSPEELSYVEKQKLNFIKALLNKSKLVLLDDIFCYFDKFSKIEFMGLIKKYQLESKVTIIYTTNSLEDMFFSDRVIIIDNGVIAFNGSIDEIYSNDKFIKKFTLNLSLENELIEKLKLYDIIDNENYTIEDLVNEICK